MLENKTNLSVELIILNVSKFECTHKEEKIINFVLFEIISSKILFLKTCEIFFRNLR
jgi:hypothetical protein